MRRYLKEGQYSIDETDLLGRGSFGTVFKAFEHQPNNRWVAIKAINLQLLEMGPEMKAIICNEISVMRKFTTKMAEKPCPYLVRQYDCFRTDTHVYIVMELCQKGTLLEYIQKNTLKEEQVKVIVQQITKGLAYLGELNICHRDIKPDNIFISQEFEDGKDTRYYKIGDFGFAAQKLSFTEVLGTYPFMAPEIFKREDYTSKVDVWSLGTITYQLLFKDLYFFGKNKWQIQEKVKNFPFTLSQSQKAKTSPQMQEFLTKCLTKEKEVRPKASQLLQLSLFTKEYEVIFQALEHELLLNELLRTMAEQICDFGIKANLSTQFIQIYLLKKSLASTSLMSYSLSNRKNYLSISAEMFNCLTSSSRKREFEEIVQKVEKQNILISNGFKTKYEQFCQYISKFTGREQEVIKSIIKAQQTYCDINRTVFKTELSQWVAILKQQTEYGDLKLKCQRLIEL